MCRWMGRRDLRRGDMMSSGGWMNARGRTCRRRDVRASGDGRAWADSPGCASRRPRNVDCDRAAHCSHRPDQHRRAGQPTKSSLSRARRRRRLRQLDRLDRLDRLEKLSIPRAVEELVLVINAVDLARGSARQHHALTTAPPSKQATGSRDGEIPGFRPLGNGRHRAVVRSIDCRRPRGRSYEWGERCS